MKRRDIQAAQITGLQHFCLFLNFSSCFFQNLRRKVYNPSHDHIPPFASRKSITTIILWSSARGEKRLREISDVLKGKKPLQPARHSTKLHENITFILTYSYYYLKCDELYFLVFLVKMCSFTKDSALLLLQANVLHFWYIKRNIKKTSKRKSKNS